MTKYIVGDIDLWLTVENSLRYLETLEGREFTNFDVVQKMKNIGEVVPDGAKLLTRAMVREAMVELNTWPDGTIDLDSIDRVIDEMFK